MIKDLKLTILCILFFGGVYPMAIWMIGATMPEKALGSPVTHNGKIVGFKNMGQGFTNPKYFWSRPSAVDYNASGSGGSQKAEAKIKPQNPVDLFTASASGLDPHISPEAAYYQLRRVADARNMAEPELRRLIEAHTEHPMLGPDVVNVLALNLSLGE